MQVVRALEASDKRVDKVRIKMVLEDMMRRQGIVQSRIKRTRNEGLERLKFWLGIPNRYYSEEEEEESESETESEGVA